MKNLLKVCVVIMLSSCRAQNAELTPQNLEGHWTLLNFDRFNEPMWPKGQFYPSINFSKTTLRLSSVGDTVYNMVYNISRDGKLMLVDARGEKKEAKIIKWSKNKFTINKIWLNGGTLVYIKN